MQTNAGGGYLAYTLRVYLLYVNLEFLSIRQMPYACMLPHKYTDLNCVAQVSELEGVQQNYFTVKIIKCHHAFWAMTTRLR